MLGLKHNMEYFPHNGDDNRIMFIVKPKDWMKRLSAAYSGQIPLQWKEDDNPSKRYWNSQCCQPQYGISIFKDRTILLK
jgi:hypothetical protein